MVVSNQISNAVGIDLGVAKTIAVSGDRADFHLPGDQIKRLEQRIAIIQRRRAKCEKFSPRWQHFTKISTKLHSRIARIRKDFLHKTTTTLAKNNGVIVMEDLRVKNMSASAAGTVAEPGKNVAAKRGLNRSILRQGWGMIKLMLTYKCGWYGSRLVLVNPKNTSSRCSCCGFTSIENRQTQASFRCVQCGHNENADKNAAKNILRLGLESLGVSSLEDPAVA